MWPKTGHHGPNVPTNNEIELSKSVRDDDPEYWEEATHRGKDVGRKSGRITMYSVSQDGDKLIEPAHLNPTSEQYQQTVFMCAIVFASIVVLGEANLESRGRTVEDLGADLIVWLFGEENISFGKGLQHDSAVERDCCWNSSVIHLKTSWSAQQFIRCQRRIYRGFCVRMNGISLTRRTPTSP
jgi:hypothetical protein